jgi:hypothetical protein
VFVHREWSNSDSNSVPKDALRQLSFEKSTATFYGELEPGVYDILATGTGFNPGCSKRRLDPSDSQSLEIHLQIDSHVSLYP